MAFYCLWFWLLYAVMLLLVGLQLVVFWLIMRVLDELNRREIEIAQDMEGVPLASTGGAVCQE